MLFRSPGAHPGASPGRESGSEEHPAGAPWRRRTQMWPGHGALVPSCQPAFLLAFPHRWDVPRGPDGEAQGSLQAALGSSSAPLFMNPVSKGRLSDSPSSSEQPQSLSPFVQALKFQAPIPSFLTSANGMNHQVLFRNSALVSSTS